jgi:pimeloyl-ACP methyl ester carboxylesterase
MNLPSSSVFPDGPHGPAPATPAGGRPAPAAGPPAATAADGPAATPPAPAQAAWREIDWRSHQRWIELDGAPVNVIELGPESARGQTQPLVFVHGLSGSWPNWLAQLAVFAAERRVIALDLPGFGHSPMPRQKISISGYARMLDELLDRLGVDAAAVIGNSMGGFIGAELAIAFPQRVERLVLVSAAGLSTHNVRGSAQALPVMRRFERILMATGAWAASKSDAVVRRARLRDAALAVVVAHPERLDAALAAEQVRGAGKPGFIQGLEAVLDYEIRERLGEIACPTLIVWGERDRLISVRDADLFARLIPNSRKVIFEDTGHVAMLERPRRFNALLEQFLAE